MYVIPQLHGTNFQYLRVPRLNVGCFVAPKLSTVLTVPSNPSPAFATQLADQVAAQDHLLGTPLGTVPHPQTLQPAHLKAPPPSSPLAAVHLLV